MKAVMLLNGVVDSEPMDIEYCIKLAFKLDPEGKFLRVKVVEV
jgi:hypothetical protein